MDNQPERPPFLTVLCILTFVWAGASILISLFQIPNLYIPTADNPQIQVSMEQLKETNPDVAERMMTVFAEADKNKVPNWIFSFVGNCFSLMGALMMWHMQKRGFFIYAAAELIPTIFSLTFSGLSGILDALGTLGPFVHAAIIIAIVCVFLFDIAFIVLYGLHLKYMS
jgi:hypothetical protein